MMEKYKYSAGHLYIYFSIIEYDGEIYIEMPGGVLSVEFEKNTPYLTGEVDLQYDFSIYKEDL